MQQLNILAHNFNITQMFSYLFLLYFYSSHTPLLLPLAPLRGGVQVSLIYFRCQLYPSPSVFCDGLPLLAVRTCPFKITFGTFPIKDLVFLFFYHPLLLSMLFLTVCLCQLFVHVLPISFCFRLLSSLGVFHANLFSQFIHLPSIFLGYFAYYLDPLVFCSLYLLLSFCQCQFSHPYIQAGTTQASNTFPFSCFYSST